MQKLLKVFLALSVFGQVYASDYFDNLERKYQNRLNKKQRNQSINFARRSKEAFHGDFDPRPKRERAIDLPDLSRTNNNNRR